MDRLLENARDAPFVPNPLLAKTAVLGDPHRHINGLLLGLPETLSLVYWLE